MSFLLEVWAGAPRAVPPSCLLPAWLISQSLSLLFMSPIDNTHMHIPHRIPRPLKAWRSMHATNARQRGKHMCITSMLWAKGTCGCVMVGVGVCRGGGEAAASPRIHI